MKEVHLEKVPSTHLYAKEHIDELKEHPITLISAQWQTNGIGRRKGTSWHSTNGDSITWTFVIKGPINAPIHNAAQILALSLIKVTPEPLLPEFKWPNDLLLNGKKFAGVMGDVINGDLIVSLGANINFPKEQLAKIDVPATSLSVELGTQIDLPTFKEKLLKKIEADFALFMKEGFKPFLTLARERLALIGKAVKIDQKEGILKDIDQEGRILLETPEGLETIASGHIERINQTL